MAVSVDYKVENSERYKMFLRLFSTLMSLNLSEREIDILDRFCLHENSTIDSQSRKNVCEHLKITDFNLNNYLRKLRVKNIVKDDKLQDSIIINVYPLDKPLSIIFNLIS